MITSRWQYVDRREPGAKTEVWTQCDGCGLTTMDSVFSDDPQLMIQTYRNHVRRLRANGCACHEGPSRPMVWDPNRCVLVEATSHHPVSLAKGSNICCPRCGAVAYVAARNILRYERLLSEMFRYPDGSQVPHQSEIRCRGCGQRYGSVRGSVLDRPML